MAGEMTIGSGTMGLGVILPTPAPMIGLSTTEPLNLYQQMTIMDSFFTIAEKKDTIHTLGALPHVRHVLTQRGLSGELLFLDELAKRMDIPTFPDALAALVPTYLDTVTVQLDGLKKAARNSFNEELAAIAHMASTTEFLNTAAHADIIAPDLLPFVSLSLLPGGDNGILSDAIEAQFANRLNQACLESLPHHRLVNEIVPYMASNQTQLIRRDKCSKTALGVGFFSAVAAIALANPWALGFSFATMLLAVINGEKIEREKAKLLPLLPANSMSAELLGQLKSADNRLDLRLRRKDVHYSK